MRRSGCCHGREQGLTQLRLASPPSPSPGEGAWSVLVPSSCHHPGLALPFPPSPPLLPELLCTLFPTWSILEPLDRSLGAIVAPPGEVGEQRGNPFVTPVNTTWTILPRKDSLLPPYKARPREPSPLTATL